MKNRVGKRIIATIVIICIFLPAALYGCAAPSNPVGTAEVVILHTNDQHGRVAGDDNAVIGVEHIAAIHKSTPGSMLIDAGDTLHGLPVATLKQGEDIVSLMNAAGYDAMVVGNHDFNYGFTRLTELRDMADFPIFSSNVTLDGTPFLDDTEILEMNGVKIGMFGISTEATARSAMPEYVRGLAFEDPVSTAKAKANALREQGAQIIVAICHLGVVPDKGTLSTRLASEAPEIDVIIDGHSHTPLEEGMMENGVLIAQAGQYEGYLGKVVILLEDGRITSKTASLIPFEEAVSTPPDEAVAAKLSEIQAEQEIVLKETVGEAAREMSSDRAPGVRTQEMPLGNLVADAYREASGADIAIANGGDIRADIIPGVVTRGGIISILPFGNTLMVKTVTPALLREALENSVSGIVTDENGNIDHEQSAQGRFLQVSGFGFSYDPTAPAGERVVSIWLEGGASLPLDDNTTQLRLAGTNYVMTGGDYYDMLGRLPVESELGAADEALAEYVKIHSPVEAPDTGRIEIMPEAVEDAA